MAGLDDEDDGRGDLFLTLFCLLPGPLVVAYFAIRLVVDLWPR